MKNQEPTNSENTEQAIILEELISEGKWVKLEKKKKTVYMALTGKTRTWVAVKITAGRGQLNDGMAVVSALQRTLHEECAILGKKVCLPLGG